MSSLSNLKVRTWQTGLKAFAVNGQKLRQPVSDFIRPSGFFKVLVGIHFSKKQMLVTQMSGGDLTILGRDRSWKLLESSFLGKFL